jgi:hypothetical protein
MRTFSSEDSIFLWDSNQGSSPDMRDLAVKKRKWDLVESTFLKEC